MVLRTRIKELRAERNITQSELAEAVNVRRETIVHLENEKYNPSLKLAYDIAQYFQCSIEKVFWYELEA